MKYTKEQLFASALALNGDGKRYIITVEDNKIITRVKWMDAVLFSPTSVSNEMREFEYSVTVNDDGTYYEVEKYVDTSGSVHSGGLGFSKRAFYGKRASRTVVFGLDQQTGKTGIVDVSFNSAEYIKPVKELMQNAGYKKKMWPVAKCIIGAACVIVVAALVAIIISVGGAGAKEPIGVDEFEEKALAGGYEIQIQEASTQNQQNVCVALDQRDGYQIVFYSFDDSASAKAFYRSKKSDFESIASGDDYSTSSTSTPNFEKYSASVDESYMYVARIENTVVLVNVKADHKQEVTEFVKELGY